MSASHLSRTGTATWIAVFIVCIVLSNWALLHIGFDAGPDHPRTIPLGFGLHAPSGVLFAGALLTVRDVIHERIGFTGTFAVIALSAPLTALSSAPSLAAASSATFFIAEFADLLVYSRVRRHSRALAVVSSNVTSSVIDSALFLTIAFGAGAAVHGAIPMTIGKLAASMVTFAVLAATARARRSRCSLLSATGVSADVLSRTTDA